MNANELMLGNYVEFENQLHQIIGITDDEINLSRKSDSGKNHITYWVGIYSVKPIPLTEKWLLDFEFFNKGNEIVNQYEENTNVFCFGEDNKVKIKFNKEWYGDVKENALFHICFYQFDDFICCLKYVHQLQNLYFSLTGINLQFLEPK
jgi:hypothetical protein